MMKLSTVSVKASTAMLVTLCLVGSLTVGCSADWTYLFSIEEMTQWADVIIVGKVESILHSPTLKNVPYMHRQVRVFVERYLKHFINSTHVTVIVKGATFGNSSIIYSDAPEFEESERVLLFLKDGVNGFYEVLGDAQGKFTINNDTAVSEIGLVIENIRGLTETDISYGRMIEEADFIVVGNVTRIHETSFVNVTIAVEEYLTNPQNDSEIMLSARDAVVGLKSVGPNIATLSNSDLFEVGERVFVFVERQGPRLWVLDGEAGKYTVVDEMPPYIHSSQGIIGGWNTAPGWKPQIVVHSDAKPTGHEITNLFPSYLTQILFAVLLIPLVFMFMKKRKKIL